MMLEFRRKVLIMSAVLGVLVVAYVLGLVFSPASVRRRETQTPLFSILSEEVVSQVQLKSPDGSLTLSKEGDSWTVPVNGVDFPAAESRIQGLVDHLVGLKRIQTVTQNPEEWGTFEVGKDAPRRLALLDAQGKAVADLLIGKEGTGGQGTYVRIQGSDTVILVDKSFDYYLNVTPKFWSYLRVFPKDLEGRDLNRISVRSSVKLGDSQGDTLRYTLTLGDKGSWQVEQPARPGLALSDKEVDQVANSLAGFEGTEFVAGISDEQAGLTRPQAEVLFDTTGKQSYRLLVGKAAGEKQYYVKLAGETFSYRAASWRLENILKPLEDLVEKPEESAASAAKEGGGQAGQ